MDIDATGPGGRVVVEAKGEAPPCAQQVNCFRGAIGELVRWIDDPWRCTPWPSPATLTTGRSSVAYQARVANALSCSSTSHGETPPVNLRCSRVGHVR